MKTVQHSRTINTPIGLMIAVSSEKAIISFDFVKEGKTYQTTKALHPLLLVLEEEIGEYFANKRREFSLPLSPEGTDFQKAVWNTLLKIPYGETVSYAQEAKMFGNPKATRAVANANGKNPIAILVPCHRVIASNGTMGGYTGGVWRKEFLLSLERAK